MRECITRQFECRKWRRSAAVPPNKTFQLQARAFDLAGNSASAAIQVRSRWGHGFAVRCAARLCLAVRL